MSNRGVQPAGCDIRVVQGAHVFDTEALGGGVELPGQAVDDDQQLLGGQPVRQVVEAQHVGEQHGDVVVVLGDGFLSVEVAPHHRLGHQGQHQPFVLGALFLE